MNNKEYGKFLNKFSSCPGIMDRENYFNSVVLVPFIMINNECHILFQKRAADIRQGGEICFPGGGYDLGKETTKEAVIRETVEELGIEKNKIELDARLDTVVAPMGAVVDVFAGKLLVEDIQEMNINRHEVERVFIIPFKYFLENKPEIYQVRLEVQPSYVNSNNEKIELFPVKELGIPERYTEPWGGKLHDVYVYKYDGEVIWGLTSRIVVSLVNYYLK